MMDPVGGKLGGALFVGLAALAMGANTPLQVRLRNPDLLIALRVDSGLVE
jgi:hypothetical protein